MVESFNYFMVQMWIFAFAGLGGRWLMLKMKNDSGAKAISVVTIIIMLVTLNSACKFL